MRRVLSVIWSLIVLCSTDFEGLVHLLGIRERRKRGLDYSGRFQDNTQIGAPSSTVDEDKTELLTYFRENSVGPGIWKWEHYLSAYEKHFSKFKGKKVRILEIGIYSGGSLEMWRSYFGENCEVIGVDIEESCRAYENEYTSVYIGDQEDPLFWRNLFSQIGPVDIVIDDGGHSTAQQIVTFEEAFPNLLPGGIFVCEDIHGVDNRFTSYSLGLIDELNSCVHDKVEGVAGSFTTELQSVIKYIALYPFLLVIEKNTAPVDRLVAPKFGSSWQPFFDRG